MMEKIPELNLSNCVVEVTITNTGTIEQVFEDE